MLMPIIWNLCGAHGQAQLQREYFSVRLLGRLFHAFPIKI